MNEDRDKLFPLPVQGLGPLLHQIFEMEAVRFQFPFTLPTQVYHVIDIFAEQADLILFAVIDGYGKIAVGDPVHLAGEIGQGAGDASGDERGGNQPEEDGKYIDNDEGVARCYVGMQCLLIMDAGIFFLQGDHVVQAFKPAPLPASHLLHQQFDPFLPPVRHAEGNDLLP